VRKFLIDVVYVKIDEQVANIFTKTLGKEKFEYFRDRLGVHEMDVMSLRGSVKNASSKKIGGSSETAGVAPRRQLVVALDVLIYYVDSMCGIMTASSWSCVWTLVLGLFGV